MLLSTKEILERVDEYTLYCFYLGFEPDIGTRYSSPLRVDKTPSFQLFIPTRNYTGEEYMWKDHVIGSGTIFELIRRLYGYRSRDEAIIRIMEDFSLGWVIPTEKPEKIILQSKPKECKDTRIEVASKPFDKDDFAYWKLFNINEAILIEYNVTRVKWFKTTKRPEAKYPSFPTYAYRIWDRYQLYTPRASKNLKFCSSYTEDHLPGFCQLKFDQPLLIITKSLKDVMMFRSFGYEAVSVRGESIFIPKDYQEYLESQYDRIVVWMDNDGKTNAELYPYEKIYVPRESGEKDPSDYCKRYRPEKTLLLIKQLLAA